VISEEPAQRRPRARRSDGEQTRAVILDAAARLATVEGIGGLSLARLADAVGMSKSGLFAHFGSKEELQLATVETASTVFFAQVVEPALAARSGIERLRRLADRYLTYVEADTFPGGCFFASVLAEVDMQPGAVRDRLAGFLADWLDRLETAARDAQADGAIDPAEDPAQIAFEVEAALLLANAQYIVTRTPEPVQRARRAIERRLAAAGTR
jgi:AcrR family transcriptional regulator